QLRVVGDLAHIALPRVSDRGCFEQGVAGVSGECGEGSLDDLLEFAAVGVTTSGSVEAFVGDHVGAVEDQGGEALPLAFVLDREHYLGAVATRKGPVGGDGGMGRSGSSRAGSAIAGEVERVAHPFDERV